MKIVIAIAAIALGSFAFSVMAQPPQRAAPAQASASQPHKAGASKVHKDTPRAPSLRLPDPQARNKLGESRLCACVANPNQA